MAINVRKLFSSDWSIGITGYAAPVPELGIKTLFAFYAVAFQNKILKTQKLTCPDKGLYQVQVYYTERVIMDLNKLLKARVK